MVPKLVIIALLALAIFFYVRAIAPPGEDSAAGAGTVAQGTASHQALAPVAGSAALPPPREAAPASGGLDPNLVGALKGVMDSAPDDPAPRDDASPGSAPQSGDAGTTVPTGPLPVPSAELERLKEVFAPELLEPR